MTNHMILIPAADSLLSVGETCEYPPVHWRGWWNSQLLHQLRHLLLLSSAGCTAACT